MCTAIHLNRGNWKNVCECIGVYEQKLKAIVFWLSVVNPLPPDFDENCMDLKEKSTYKWVLFVPADRNKDG